MYARAMNADIDHVVLWVRDPVRSAEFYRDVVGLEPLRVAEFQAKAVPFPSVRLSERTVFDLAPLEMATPLNGMGRKVGLTVDAAGHPVHHVCLAMTHADFDALRERVKQAGLATFALKEGFGARGRAPDAFYFHDLDQNVLEARYYE